MKSLIDYVKHPISAVEAAVKSLASFLPDKLYLSILFRVKMGKWINWKNPQTFNEKLQWLKLYNRVPEYTSLVDKIEVKKWVADKIGEQYVIPTLAEWDSVEEITQEQLPDRFVMKCNHSGGNTSVFIVKDKRTFNLNNTKSILADTLKGSIYTAYREWPYKNVRRRVFAEQLLESADGKPLADYKFFCYNGNAESVMLCLDRNTGDTKFYFFNRDWELKRYNIRGKNAPADFTLPKPDNMDKMFEIAAKLSEGLPFVRVDLYNVDGRIYFGEMTFFPASGLDRNLLPETDSLFGSFIKLPKN